MRRATAKPIAARVVLALAVSAGSAPAATIVVSNDDKPGAGFNDATTVPAVPGNPETTRGAQALAAFRKGASFWEAQLDSPVPI